MKLKPVGYIGIDAFEAISCGESIQPTMTPKVVCEDDAPLYAIPPGYVLVKADQIKEAREIVAKEYASDRHNGRLYNAMDLIDRAMIEGEQ